MSIFGFALLLQAVPLAANPDYPADYRHDWVYTGERDGTLVWIDATWMQVQEIEGYPYPVALVRFQESDSDNPEVGDVLAAVNCDDRSIAAFGGTFYDGEGAVLERVVSSPDEIVFESLDRDNSTDSAILAIVCGE